MRYPLPSAYEWESGLATNRVSTVSGDGDDVTGSRMDQRFMEASLHYGLKMVSVSSRYQRR